MTCDLTWPVMGTLLAALMMAGCRQNTATAPSPTHPSAATDSLGPFQTYLRSLSGHIFDEEGHPVPNAAVFGYSGSAAGCCDIAVPPALTDSSGAYQTVVTALEPPFAYIGTGVTVIASSAGFDQTNGFVPGTTTTVHDFVVFRPLTLTPGTDLHLHLDMTNSLCGLDGEFSCRSILVTGPPGKTMVVETIPDDPTQPVWLGINGVSYSKPTSVSFPTSAVVEMFVPDSTIAVNFVIHATVQ
jgi:hypothetical protein